jgi:hypothetical protein
MMQARQTKATTTNPYQLGGVSVCSFIQIMPVHAWERRAASRLEAEAKLAHDWRHGKADMVLTATFPAQIRTP